MFLYITFWFFFPPAKLRSPDPPSPFRTAPQRFLRGYLPTTVPSKVLEQNTWQFLVCAFFFSRQQRISGPATSCHPKIPAGTALWSSVDDLKVPLGGKGAQKSAYYSPLWRPEPRTGDSKCLSSLPLLATRWYCLPSADVGATGLQWPTILNTVHMEFLQINFMYHNVNSAWVLKPSERDAWLEEGQNRCRWDSHRDAQHCFSAKCAIDSTSRCEKRPSCCLQKARGWRDVSWNPHNPIMYVATFPLNTWNRGSEIMCN